jgi:eukaryotic-like serine/threonine-protein kinase
MSISVAAPLEAGAEIAPGYLVLAHLSRGRRLDVYDAWSEERGSRVVIKALRPERLDHADSRDALLTEGRLLERLTHPHIVRGYETITDPQPLVVLETLIGETLSHLIENAGRRLTTEEVSHLGLQLGSAVRYLHRNGFLHLDLKPSNVIAEPGRLKLIDLSLARPPGPAPRRGIGTWSYLSPEQAAGGRLGEAADVWGLGAVLFEAVVGQEPFEAPTTESGTDGSSISDSYEDPDLDPDEYPQLWVRPPRVAGSTGVAPGLAELIDSSLELDPARRPRMVEVLRALEGLAGLPPAELHWRRGPAA